MFRIGDPSPQSIGSHRGQLFIEFILAESHFRWNSLTVTGIHGGSAIPAAEYPFNSQWATFRSEYGVPALATR